MTVSHRGQHLPVTLKINLQAAGRSKTGTSVITVGHKPKCTGSVTFRDFMSNALYPAVIIF